ncbi:MAG: hypothetical protein HQL95_00625 [Magnetococcales bacterium]|nr:hypothetical protein [Magnetococcales bacterium]
MQKIRYIGNKPFKRDTVTKSGTVWQGRGDVQEVDDKFAEKLLLFPDIWEVAVEETPPVAPPPPKPNRRTATP